MTDYQLAKAKEIKESLELLQESLLQISRGRLFNIETNTCSMKRHADDFLAMVENDIKIHATDAILKRIKELEEEFDSL